MEHWRWSIKALIKLDRYFLKMEHYPFGEWGKYNLQCPCPDCREAFKYKVTNSNPPHKVLPHQNLRILDNHFPTLLSPQRKNNQSDYFF